jgi:hypothetical protein
MFSLSLDYSLSVSVFRVPNVSLVIRLFIVGLCVSCTQCFPCRYIIHCWSLCFVHPMFPLSLNYSLLVSVFRVPNVSLVIRLVIVGLCVSCTQCFPCHWIIHCWSLCFVYPMFSLSLDYSLLVSVFRAPNVSFVIRLFNVGLCVSCTQCFPCHYIIHCWSLCFVYAMFPLSLDYSLLVSVFLLMTRETLGTRNTETNNE